MIGLQATLLLLLGACCSATDHPEEPNCSTCVYHNNIGFVGSEVKCQLYYMCIKNPYTDGSPQTYRIQAFCCAEGLSWDQEHLTCVRDSYCNHSRDWCPLNTTTTDFPCPMYEGPTASTYFSPGYELMECPYGTRWSQEDCTCVFADFVVREPCTKLLHFTFTNNSFDSDSCYNFAKGEPYGKPSLANDVLCLNGVDQFMQVGFLNNWFAWNPQARTFTVCLSVLPGTAGQTAGILSLNCDMVDPQSGAAGSVLDILLNAGDLQVQLGTQTSGPLTPLAIGAWTRLCVTFNRGVYKVYSDAMLEHTELGGAPNSPFAPNTHSAATLGFKDAVFGAFNGYIDDFCFYNEALNAAGIGAELAANPAPAVISY